MIRFFDHFMEMIIKQSLKITCLINFNFEIARPEMVVNVAMLGVDGS